MKHFKGLSIVGCCAWLVAAWLAGCGGVSVGTGSSPGTDPISVEQLPDQFASAVCDNISGCCAAAAFAFDLATCKANVKASISQSIAEQVASNSVRYEASAAGSCVAAYADAVKSCQGNDSTLVDDACSKVFVGLLAVGAACTSGSECAAPAGSQASCEFSSGDSGSPGRCVLETPTIGAPHGKLGEACLGSCEAGANCGASPAGPGTGTAPVVTALCFASEGLYCGSGPSCQPLLDNGQPCSFGGCMADAFCDVGLCAPKKAAGARCTSDTECQTHDCIFPKSGDTVSVDPLAGTCGTRSLASADICMGKLK